MIAPEQFRDLDGRSIPGDTMEILRQMAIRAIEEKGYSPEAIIEIFGFSRSTIYGWLKKYHENGLAGLETHHPPGAEPVITGEMDEWLRTTVLSSTPESHGYDTTLWTRDILAALLKEKFGVELTGRTVGLHLIKMDLSYQKPEYQAREQDPEEVDKFLKIKFPLIQKLADKLNADIFFEDEAGIGVQTHFGSTWGEKGKTPIIEACSARGGFNALSAVNTKGKMRYSVTEGHVDSEIYVNFMRQMLKGREKPLILIVDNVSFHKSKEVRKFHRDHRHELKIFFLPKYAPKLNPDEQVWGEIKTHNIGRQPIRNKADLKGRLFTALRSLQKHTRRIISFFELPHTRYAFGNV